MGIIIQVISVLEEVDFLSPPITLFAQGSSSYKSSQSDFLSLVALALIALFSACEIKDIFKRKSETPKSTSFTYFKADAGIVTINSSTLFHFLSLEDYNNKGNEEFDFSYFNVISFEEPIPNFENNEKIENYNHWLYGYCNNSTDIENIEDIVTNNFLTKSACIRKYYDKETKAYYDTNSPNFRWPSMSHGTFHPENQIYSIIMMSCNQSYLDNVFQGELSCKDINEYDMNAKIVHLNFIDEYIDILNYNKPVTKYAYRIENKLDKDNYSINHLNFNPSIIKSHIGYVFDKEEVEFSIYFDRNDVFTYTKNIDLFMGYTFYLNNRIRYYERTYITIPDILSSIGGILNIVISIMTLINDFIINPYKILKDFNYLLNLFSITEDDILKTNRKNIINKKLKQIENIKKISCTFSKPLSSENAIKEVEKGEDKETVTDQTLNSEEVKNNEAPKTTEKESTSNITAVTNKQNPGDDNDKQVNQKIFSFCDYFIYKITFRKKHKELEIYENFRKKIISVENLTQNYLGMNNLLQLEKRRSKLSSINK